jgi:hypothetical protein
VIKKRIGPGHTGGYKQPKSGQAALLR